MGRCKQVSLFSPFFVLPNFTQAAADGWLETGRVGSPEILDIERLVSPIGDNGVGEDLRLDASPTSVYYQIKDLRSQARKAERKIEMGDDADPPDWRPIIAMVPDVLAERAKDLEIAAYLVEALGREHGFAGLRDGFRLVEKLVEQFGNDIFPLPDEDGEETRVAPLTGLNGDGGNGTLITPISNIPLTDVTSAGEFGQSAYVQAQDLERSPPDVKERRVSQGAVSLDTFQLAVAETNADFFVNLMNDINDCREAFAEMTSTLDAQYGNDSPPSSQIMNLLDECKATLESVARDKLAVAEVAEVAAEADADAASDEPSGGGGGAGPRNSQPKAVLGTIENRNDAFREIMRIAQYFRETEPHSPISYALEQIVRWGRLPLPDLLKELISDESSISQMFRLVGIRGDDSHSDGQA